MMMCLCVCDVTETDRQVDRHVGAVKQRDTTTQPLTCRRRHTRDTAITARCRSAASSSGPPSADESYQT